MKHGALIFDKLSDRYDVCFDLADYYGACIVATVWRCLWAATPARARPPLPYDLPPPAPPGECCRE